MKMLIQLLAIALAATLFSTPVQGQDEEGDSTNDVTTLDLFNEDTELTRKGWLQFYATFGAMPDYFFSDVQNQKITICNTCVIHFNA